jgi:single-strand DNA-binding protein
MNKLIALGNLGHAASVRTVEHPTRGSQPVVNFSLAVKLGYGERERTQWYECAWWGERAERASQWLTKGKRVLVEGEPELELYEKRDGTKGAKVVVRVVSVDFADAAKGPAAQAMETAAAAATVAEEKPAEYVPY